MDFSPSTGKTKIRRKSLEKTNQEREAQGQMKREREAWDLGRGDDWGRRARRTCRYCTGGRGRGARFGFPSGNGLLRAWGRAEGKPHWEERRQLTSPGWDQGHQVKARSKERLWYQARACGWRNRVCVWCVCAARVCARVCAHTCTQSEDTAQA